MKLAIGNVDIDPRIGDHFELDIRDPGIIRGAVIAEKSPSPIMLANGTAPGDPFVPRLIIEVDPDRPVRRRKFVVLPVPRGIETDAELEFRALFVNANGDALALYEVM